MTPGDASSKKRTKHEGMMAAVRDLLTRVNEAETARHYCRRLAAIVLLPGYRDTFSNSLTCVERARILREPLTWQLLAKRFEISPRLQSIAASCTSYTPSVWLLEQELIARGKCDAGCNLPLDDNSAAMCDATALDIYRLARTANSSGLCFSGGGIRSATFN